MFPFHLHEIWHSPAETDALCYQLCLVGVLEEWLWGNRQCFRWSDLKTKRGTKSLSLWRWLGREVRGNQQPLFTKAKAMAISSLQDDCASAFFIKAQRHRRRMAVWYGNKQDGRINLSSIFVRRYQRGFQTVLHLNESFKSSLEDLH